MKCQILFSGKNKKHIINLLSAENAERVVMVNLPSRNFCVVLRKFVMYVEKKKKKKSLSLTTLTRWCNVCVTRVRKDNSIFYNSNSKFVSTSLKSYSYHHFALSEMKFEINMMPE